MPAVKLLDPEAPVPWAVSPGFVHGVGVRTDCTRLWRFSFLPSLCLSPLPLRVLQTPSRVAAGPPLDLMQSCVPSCRLLIPPGVHLSHEAGELVSGMPERPSCFEVKVFQKADYSESGLPCA